MDSRGIDFLIFIAALLVGLVLGLLVGSVVANCQMRTQAVENGVAYWEIETNGGTIFHWNGEKIE